jgi:hypothetical protein
VAVKAADTVASFDSASAMLLATARFLLGQDFAHLGQPAVKALPVRASTLLPKRTRQRVYGILGALEGSRPEELGDIDLEDVAAWVTGHYPRGPYPAVFIGSSNGALVHLAAAVGAPWLPQTLLLPVRRWRAGGSDGSAQAALEFGARVAGPLLARNPHHVLHHMHDPNQDELMVRHMAYFRVKRTRLGPAYEQWLNHRLAPGAPVVLVEDLSRWPTTRVSERHSFQNGAQGGLRPEEYTGTQPDGESAEAEWGFEPELGDDVSRWAATNGHPVHRLRLDCPEALSAPVADLHRRWADSRGAIDRLLLESFVLLDPFHVARTGAAPFWTMFPVQPSASRAAAYLDSRARFNIVDGLLFNHGADSQGLASARTWRALVDRGERPSHLLGVTASRFPVDFASLARYGPALRHLDSAPDPPRTHDLSEVIEGTSRAPGVLWSRRRP